MTVTIGANLASFRAQRQLGTSTDTLGAVFERLATGQRINRASDDAAGLSIAMSLRTDVRIHTQAIRNLNDAVSVSSVAEGAVQQLTTVVQRLRELSAQASTGSLGHVQRRSLDREGQQLIQEFNRILDTTKFNGLALFSHENRQLWAEAAGSQLQTVLGAFGAVGTETFGNSQTVSFTASGAVSAIDLNADGILDLVRGGNGSTSLRVSLGNGDGTFQADSGFQGYAPVQHSSFGDINGDGIVDVISNSADTMTTIATMFLGNGDGTFAAGRTLETAGHGTSVTLFDANNDGRLDIGYRGTGGALRLHFGNGDGTFGEPIQSGAVSNPTSQLLARDFNGDGFVDTAFGADVNLLRVYLSNGNGTFGTTITLATTFANGVFSGSTDFNNDGILDLVYTSATSDVSNVFIGNGNGTFKAVVSLEFEANTRRLVGLQDINSDGNVDIVGSSTAGNIQIFHGNGDGTFAARVTVATGGAAFSVVMGDFNNDGVPDIIQDSGSTTVRVLLSDTRDGVLSLATQRLRPGDLRFTSVYEARKAQGKTDDLLTHLASTAASIGTARSRIGYASEVLSASRLARNQATDTIESADIAGEAARLVLTQIRQQAAQAVLSQANLQPTLVLSLLK